jgi:acyl-CoA hydrolase
LYDVKIVKIKNKIWNIKQKLIRPEDLNSRGTVFGGTILKWIDEAAIYAMCQLKTKNIVTKLISEINFMSPGYQGDVIEIGINW